MCKQIHEKEILLPEIIDAPVNNVWRWHRELQYILANEKINKNVRITFTTINGNRVVKTHIEDVIENYVRISGGVIIPLGSIRNIYPEDTVIVVNDHHERVWIAVSVVAAAIICLLILCYVFYWRH